MAYDAPGGTGQNLSVDTWDETIQSAIYERSRFLQRTKDYGAGRAQKTIRKLGNSTGQIIASTDDGTGMTFSSMNPTLATLIPAWMFVGHQYPDSLEWTVGQNIDPKAAQDAENALMAYIESQFLQDVASLSNFIGDAAYDIDAAGYRGAVANLMALGLTETDPESNEIFGLLPQLQHDDLMSIPEFTNADQRGDGQNPHVTGIIGKGNAVRQMFSSLLYGDVNGTHGLIWVASAFGHFFNKRAGGEKQRFKKTTYVMADAHFAHNIIYDNRAVAVRVKPT